MLIFKNKSARFRQRFVKNNRGETQTIIFLVALLFAAVGLWLVFDTAKEAFLNLDLPVLSTKPAAPSATPTPALYADIEENFVLVVSKLGEYEPKMVRGFEEKFSGKIQEFSYDSADAVEKLKTQFKTARPETVLTVGEGAAAWLKANEKNIPGLDDIQGMAIQDSVSEGQIAQKKPFFIAQRPPPDSVFRTAGYILRDAHKKMVIVYQTPLDDAYAEALYAQGLSQQFEVELKGVGSEKNYEAVLKTLPKDLGWFLVVESKMLATQFSTDIFRRFYKDYAKPFITLGSDYENLGTVCAITPDIMSLGNALPILVARLQAKEIPNASVPLEYTPNIAIKVYVSRANKLHFIRAESYANLLKRDSPLYQITVLN